MYRHTTGLHDARGSMTVRPADFASILITLVRQASPAFMDNKFYYVVWLNADGVRMEDGRVEVEEQLRSFDDAIATADLYQYCADKQRLRRLYAVKTRDYSTTIYKAVA
jgi:hypothetical protein